MDSGVEYWRATAFDMSEAACMPLCYMLCSGSLYLLIMCVRLLIKVF